MLQIALCMFEVASDLSFKGMLLVILIPIVITVIIIIIAIANSISCKGKVRVRVKIHTKEQVIKVMERQITPWEGSPSTFMYYLEVLLLRQ